MFPFINKQSSQLTVSKTVQRVDQPTVMKPNLIYSCALAIVLILAGSPADADQDNPIVFEKHIRPILKQHCFHCHGEEAEVSAGLDLRLRRFLAEGGDSGAAIVPGDPENSLLVEVLRSGQMPEGKDPLPDQEIDLIAKWIQQGAPTARPEPENVADLEAFTEEERSWWSLQPIASPPVPAANELTSSTNPIDRFVAQSLQQSGLTFSPAAEARTLIRRLHFHLTGLPPSPDEITAFCEQYKYAPESAYQSLIQRLLNSQAYGERWARHWLDIAGYADSNGFDEKDVVRQHAWRYRDYVIRSLNNDKPYDQFIREQLAGDEIAASLGVHANSPQQQEQARYAELLTATGFLRMAPDGSVSQNNIATRNQCVADTIKIISTALYGMTIECAQCHNHRYDPITQADYYSLRAIFDPGFDVPRWRVPKNRLVSLQTKAQAEQAANIEKEAKKIDAERTAKQKEFIAEVLEKELAKREEAIRDDLRVAYNTDAKQRTDEQKKLLSANPSVNKLSASSLYLYDSTYKTKHAATLKEIAARAQAIRDTKPTEEFVHAFTEPTKDPKAVVTTHVFFRGNPESPKEKVLPSDLSVLASWRTTDVPEFTDEVPSTGRRLAFARSVTDGKHPLLARVIVNRVWKHHFGRGLVSTTGDFGILGERPAHPELLDWLASEFMASGWSLKELHRLILTSQTWQQSSKRSTLGDEIDPDNRLLSRQNTRRLEAEALRDTLLTVTGKLNRKPFGPPIPVMPTTDGSIVVGNDTTDSAGRQTGKYIPLNGEEYRRSIYVQVRRSRPLDMLTTFDAPSMTDPNCVSRPETTVSPQSLLMMNNAGMREHARDFATRLKNTGPPDQAAQIRMAFELCYGRAATDAEVTESQSFIAAQEQYYKDNPAKFETESGPAAKENASAQDLALAAFCHALLSTNEFLYID